MSFIYLPSELWTSIIEYCGKEFILDTIRSLIQSCSYMGEILDLVYPQIRSLTTDNIGSKILNKMGYLQNLECVDVSLWIFDYLNTACLDHLRILKMTNNRSMTLFRSRLDVCLPRLEKLSITSDDKIVSGEYTLSRIDAPCLREIEMENICLDLREYSQSLKSVTMSRVNIFPGYMLHLRKLHIDELHLDSCGYTDFQGSNHCIRLEIPSLKRLTVDCTEVSILSSEILEDLIVIGDYSSQMAHIGNMPRLKRLTIIRGCYMDTVDDKLYPVLESVYLEEMTQISIISSRSLSIKLVGCRNAEFRDIDCPNARILEID